MASTGALLDVSGYAPYNHDELFSWPESGSVTDFGPTFGVKVVGDTAAWVPLKQEGEDLDLVLRDVVRTNEEFTLTFARSNNPVIYGFDLGPNLDLVYSLSGNIFRSRPASSSQPYTNRSSSQLTFSNADGFPVTDGTNVVLVRNISTNSYIVRVDAAGEETLSTWLGFSSNVQYLTRNGWVAFSKPGTTGQEQIWTRSPSGVLQQRTFFGSSSSLESLGPAGEITAINSSITPAGRYLGLVGTLPWWIGPDQGRVRWDADRPLVLLGRSIFEVVAGQLTSQKLGGGDFKLAFNGPLGIQFILQTSSNLLQWSELLRFTNNAGTAWTNTTGARQKFYRAVVSSE